MQNEQGGYYWVVHTNVTAVRRGPERPGLVTIPRGTRIFVREYLNTSGLLESDYNGEVVLIYRRDIEERAERERSGQ